MLSTENPPPDLPCPCGEISQLKSSSNDEERASDDNNQQHNQFEVDLFKSGGLDDTNTNPLPKFSIRDYVFSTRNKDVKNNWPFSLKTLQLCLKNGVKDVLPPFQSLDSVRNPSVKKPSVNDDYEVSDHSIGQKLAEDTKNIHSGGSEEVKTLPSTTRSDQSCSYINSVPQDKIWNSKPEAEYLPGSPSKKLEFAIVASNKVRSSAQNPAKKCKLILKLKNIAELKVAEELSGNNFVVSDTMATNVCPVCKTFSSSSNTTLNAHIDQCLSGESSVKWTTNPKAIKHRIKPRKSRLMMDIYETSLQCTLEDLDKRNGTKWASNLSFPEDEDLEMYAEEKNTSVNVKSNNQEGSVYIDSSGTKVRILSKLSDLPPYANDPGQSQNKLSKRNKGNELPSSKKRKSVLQKHKIMKSPPRVQRSSPRHHVEVDGVQPNNLPSKGYKDDHMQPPVAHYQMTSEGMGMIKQWVGSKRSGLKKKINPERENRRPNTITKKLANSGALSLVERDSSSMSSILCDKNQTLPTESNKRKVNLLYDSHDGFSELPCQKNTQGFSYQDCDDGRNHGAISKPNVKQSRKDNQHIMDLPNGTKNHVFSKRNKKVINISPAVNVEGSFISSRSMKHAVMSEDKRFSSLKKKRLLSVRHALVPKSKKKLGRKHLVVKNPKLHCPSRLEEEMIQSRHEINRQENAAQSKKSSDKQFVDGARVLKIQKKSVESIITSKGDIALNGSDISPESHSHGIDNKSDSFGGGEVPVGTSNVLLKDKIRTEFAYEPTYKLADGETFAAFSKPLQTEFPVRKYPSDGGYVSQQYNEGYEGHRLPEPALGGEQEEFCTNKIGNDLITSGSGHVMVENGAQGNYFVDVDPIPIPGPPGSFLPSPGRMSSEELQENSSLTACMIQSSENEHQEADLVSSDSPISVVSDSVATRSNSVSVNLPEQSHNGTQFDEAVAEGSTSIEQETTADRKSDDLHESKSDSILPEMSGHRFKSIPVCCCSRKDVVLVTDSFMNQELRQQTIASCGALDDPKEKAYLFPAKEPNQECGELTPNSLFGCGPGVVSHHPEAKFPLHSDHESPSPSFTSNPVLRLMGKNLMVANRDENLCPRSWRTQSSMVINHPYGHEDSLSTGKNQDDYYSFHPAVSHGPSIFGSLQTSTPIQSFDFSPHDGFKTPTVRSPWRSSRPSGVMFRNKSFGGNFVPSSAAYDIESIQNPAPNLRTADISGSKRKETIVIDEPPENAAAGFAIKATPQELNRNMKFGESSAPRGLQSDSRRVNPFYNYQTRGYPLPVVQNGNAQGPSALYFTPGFS